MLSSARNLASRAPSPAMIVACLALFIALGGTGYAITALPKNSVGAKQLQRNAVTGAKIKNRSLRGVDFARGQLPAGKQGPAGARGPEGQPNPNATNSDRLDGLDSQAFLSKSGGGANASTSITACGEATLVTYPVVLSRPGRLWVQAVTGRVSIGDAQHNPTLEVELRDSSGTLRAYSVRAEYADSGGPLSTGGLLFSAAGPGDLPGEIAPGSYTLHLLADIFGPCTGTSTYQDNALSHVVVDGD